jgi:hypothetical protein
LRDPRQRAGTRAPQRRGVQRIAHHLALDVVDLGRHAILRARGALAHHHARVVQPGGGADRRQLLGRQALSAHAAQHVELALAHEVVATLALDHRLELGLVELGASELA